MSIIPLSSVVLTRAEESGEVAGRYGLPTGALRNRVPASWPSAVERFGGPLPAHTLPKANAHHPLPRQRRDHAA